MGKCVVGAVLLAATPAEAARLMATAGDLEAGHFRHSLAGAAWRAERELVQAGRLPDAVSIAAALARVNGRGNPHAFVGSLLDGLPHVGDLAQWASLIRNEAPAGERSGCAWARAVAAPEFCAGSEADIAWIERPFLAPGVVTPTRRPARSSTERTESTCWAATSRTTGGAAVSPKTSRGA